MAEPVAMACGVRDITPPRPVPLAGDPARKGPFTAVADRLELAGAFFAAGDEAALLLSADLLLVTDELAAHAAAAAGDPRLTPERVLFVATHTHNAPATDPRPAALGAVDAGYMAFLRAQVADLARELVSGATSGAQSGAQSSAQSCAQSGAKSGAKSGTDAGAEAGATLAVGSRRERYGVYRRLRGVYLDRSGTVPRLRRGVLFGPDPDGPADNTLRAAALRGPDGELRTVLWGLGCHPTAFPDKTLVSADYPGQVRARLREALGMPELPVIFLLGFAGDVRPPATARPALLSRLLRPGTRIFVPFTRPQFEDWAAGIAADLAELVRSGLRDAAVPAPRAGSVRLPLGGVLTGAEGPDIVLRALDLGPGLRLLALSAEASCGYAPLVEAAGAGREVFPVSMAGSVYGYLPTDAQVAEGGYEAGGFFTVYGVSGRFVASPQDAVRAALATLASTMERR